MLQKISSWSFTHRGRVIAGWVLAVVVLSVLSGAFAHDFADGGRLPGTDSDRAYQVATREFPSTPGGAATVVFQVKGGLAQPAQRAAIERYLGRVGRITGVGRVTSPYASPDRISKDGTVGYATIDPTTYALEHGFSDAAVKIQKEAAGLSADGVRTEFGGGWFSTGSMPPSELIGLAAALVILLISFGSAVAMGVPLVTAVIGVGAASALVGLWTIVVPTPDFTAEVASMIGIGVGIDYALFIITRYRGELLTQAPLDALATTMATAGRAVVFAGCTVLVSLLGILLVGLSFLEGLALGASSAVLVAVLAAVTLLPAFLSLTTKRLQRAGTRSQRRHHDRPGMWHRWGDVVRRRPWPIALAGLATLLVLAAPVVGIRLASTDAGNDPKGSTTRAAYDTLARGFGPGSNGPLVIVAELPHGKDPAPGLARLTSRLRATPGVVLVAPALVSPSGRAAVITVVPAAAPQSKATEQLVARIRHDVVPGSGVVARVGGATANNVDFARLMGDRLPVFMGGVLALSFLLLAVVFRSVLVPVKAVLMNLLSIGASYGLMVAVFQWGWLGSLIGVGPAPIEPWVPMLLFAIVFGLSMDYEVFLLSAVREHYDRTGDNGAAVVEGLSATGRVITAAAGIMVFVFGSFLFGDIRAVKLIGFGLASAVLIDATIVRMVLVPATMELLGDRNWWLPRWADRLLPRFTLEQRPAPSAPRPVDPSTAVPAYATSADGRP